MGNISKINPGDGIEYDIKDNNAQTKVLSEGVYVDGEYRTEVEDTIQTIADLAFKARCKVSNENLTISIPAWPNIHSIINLTDVYPKPYGGCAIYYNNEVLILMSTLIEHIVNDRYIQTINNTIRSPFVLNDGCAVIYNNDIHILGGTTYPNTNHYAIHSDYSSEEVSTLPFVFANGSAIVFNNKIYIFNYVRADSKSYIYSWDGTEWSRVAETTHNFEKCSTTIYNDNIYIITKSGMLLVFDGSILTFIKGSSSTTAYDGYALFVYKHKLHRIDGASLVIMCFDESKLTWVVSSDLPPLPHLMYSGYRNSIVTDKTNNTIAIFNAPSSNINILNAIRFDGIEWIEGTDA